LWSYVILNVLFSLFKLFLVHPWPPDPAGAAGLAAAWFVAKKSRLCFNPAEEKEEKKREVQREKKEKVPKSSCSFLPFKRKTLKPARSRSQL
jgi:hypothetical protein